MTNVNHYCADREKRKQTEQKMDFDGPVNRRGINVTAYERMDAFGLDKSEAIPMWIADSNFTVASCITDALRAEVDRSIFSYTIEPPEYRKAILWWMKNRHGWDIDPDWILSVQALGHGISTCLQTFCDPGDHVVFFTPVYHEFPLKSFRNDLNVTECPLVRNGDTYDLDLDDAQSRMTGKEKVLLWCSPQNPSGRVWSAEELRSVSEFARRNNLILISDEVHHDLVYPGAKFTPMDIAAPDGRDFTIYATGASKTFNLAGLRCGQLTIPNEDLRKKVKKRIGSQDYQPASLGMTATTAAYSPAGAEWVDALVSYLDGSRKILDAGMDAIPGVHSLPLQSTFLGWVDFEGTGMDHQEIARRLRDVAKVATSPGPGFGKPGQFFMRLNFATQRSELSEAIERIQDAFSDLQ